MVCGFASSVKRKSKGRAHALEAAQSSKPTTPAVAGPASEDPAPVIELESSGGPSREKRPRDQTEAVDALPLGEEVREEAPLKRRRKKKKTISPLEVGACRVLPASFADRVDDPAARMGGTSDVSARFRVEPSSSGVRDQVSRISAASLDRCLRRASKFVSDPGSVLQRTIDYAAEVRLVSPFLLNFA
ncbi:uncharacterized protein LOC111025590 [Momordica charantia]|uniref:Uncharacterized protein LOC111025590 n=1 Tax=Momordica charantia TaxID=3673 RepID=A0A6J1E1K8_MOMCH|nr:uncharacterized protein LOC111025590 [Momordica charantia]